MAGDKGYGSPSARRCLRGRRVGAVIPTEADEVPNPAFDRAAYRERNVIERPIDLPTRWRWIATRVERRAANHEAMLTIAAFHLWP